MEEERDREEYKHVCKLCFKRYPSGKSLGGHMRSHVIANARKNKLLAALNKKVETFAAENDEEDEDEDEDDIETDIGDRNGNHGGNSGYGLRENPKKTWRMVDSYPGKLLLQQNSSNFGNGNGNGNGQERICKQCGKGFHSLKALCGHMSIHSDKDRNFKEEDDNSWSSDSKDQLFLAMESHSDNNNSMKRQTRSSLSRYRSLNSTNTTAAAVAVDSVANNGGGSSSNHSEIDQLEQEEVAICLMMLSRDSSGSKSCFNFAAAAAAAAAAAESSDNNSVILEGGLSCRNNNNVVAVAAGAGAGNKGKGKKNVDQEMDNSDSGYFENGAKELDSDDSFDGFGKNYGFNKGNNNKFDVGSRLVDCFGDDNDDDDYSRKRKIRDVGSFGFDSPDSDENNYPAGKKIKHDYFYSSNNNNNNNFNSHQKDGSSSKYGCGQCTKSFKTHQALGGHVISHSRKMNSENDANNSSAKAKNLGGSTTAKKGSVSKKVKGHKCPYCPKVFKSGQALGGHKRSHMIGSNSVLLHSEGRLNHIPAAAPPPVPEHKQPLIDLNLPAPDEEEASGNSQFVAW